MKVFVYSAKKGFALPLPPRAAKDVEVLPLSELPDHDPDAADLAYIDCSGMADRELKKACAQMMKLRPDQAWGVVDPKGEIIDPAGIFHSGASDYLGPKLLKEGLAAARFQRAVDFQNPPISSADEQPGSGCRDAAFPGWKAIKPGETREFHFLYAAMEDAASLKARIGDKRFGTLRERFRAYMELAFAETDARAWMQDDSGILFILPAIASQGRAVLQACVRMTLNAPLIAYEVFGLDVPFDFVFALHRGSCAYQPPGKTGTVVSEDVNYIFHLGTKKAEPGRIYVSSKAMGAVPPRLSGHFLPAGRFEGYEVSKSRKFL